MRIISLLLLFYFPLAAKSNLDPKKLIKWRANGGLSDPNGLVNIQLILEAKDGFQIYQDRLTFFSEYFSLVSQGSPEAKQILDPLTGQPVNVFDSGVFNLQFQGFDVPKSFPLQIRYTACSQKICLFPVTVSLDVPVTPGLIPPPLDKVEDAQAPPSVGLEEGWAEMLRTGQLSFFWILLFSFLGGMLTNLTPCVYPMIPITLRLLSGQTRKPWLGGLCYAAGIISTYSALGLFAAWTGSMFGQFMALTWVNLVFAAVMFILGLTMLGYGNLYVLQSLGERLGSSGASPKNAFFMGAGAGLVAAPCTGPILAALLAYSAQGGGNSGFLLVAYSIGFGLPYAVLGASAGKISRFSLSPLTMWGVKVGFAGVMFGLCAYYLKVPAYSLFKQDWPWLNIGFGGLSVVLVLAFLIISKKWLYNKLANTVLGVSFGFTLFVLSQAYIDQSSETDLNWYRDEAKAFAAFRNSEVRGIVIDMWAEWCAACKQMDITTFKNPVIEELLRDWVLLKLDLTEDSPWSEEVQERYQVQGLPSLYVIPKGKELEDATHLSGYVSADMLRQKIEALR